LDAMSSQFQVRYLLSRGGAMVIGILRTMCHVITDVTANHRPSSRTVRVLPVRQFAVRSSLITNTRLRGATTYAALMTSHDSMNEHLLCRVLNKMRECGTEYV